MGIFDRFRKSGKEKEEVIIINIDMDSIEKAIDCISEASLHIEKKDFDKALESYNEALKFNPFSVSALAGKAGILIIMKRFEEALKCCNKALEINPEHGGTWFNKGLCLCNGFRNYSEALICFRKAESLGINQASEIVRDLERRTKM